MFVKIIQWFKSAYSPTEELHQSAHKFESRPIYIKKTFHLFASVLMTFLLNGFWLFSVSFAAQPVAHTIQEDQLDAGVQNEIDHIDEIRKPRILLAVPFGENRERPTEKDFLRSACVYNISDEKLGRELVSIIKQSHLIAYKKSQAWRGAIVGIDYLDLIGTLHSLRFDQDYPGYEQVNGYFDGHPITASSSLIKSVYRIVARSDFKTNCDDFIDPYRK